MRRRTKKQTYTTVLLLGQRDNREASPLEFRRSANLITQNRQTVTSDSSGLTSRHVTLVAPCGFTLYVGLPIPSERPVDTPAQCLRR